MKEYHALIVGAGPAGGECARELAKKGLKVLLIEKAKTFQTNNFSSGGAPLEIMTQFALPDTVMGSYWSDLELTSSHRNYRWKSESPKGVILDFAKLKSFFGYRSLPVWSRVQTRLLLPRTHCASQQMPRVAYAHSLHTKK